MNLLLAPLRPLADLIDLATEAATAVGALSLGALGPLLAQPPVHYPTLRAVETVEAVRRHGGR